MKVEERGVTIWCIVDGKIRDEWTAFDLLRIVRQVASQLKWPLAGLLAATLLLVWGAIRLARRMWMVHPSRA